MWAAMRLSPKREMKYQRVLLNMDVESLQKVFATVHNQVQLLKTDELLGLGDHGD